MADRKAYTFRQKRFCSSCEFHHKTSEHAGQCRRHPPQHSSWVAVTPDDWCGEYSPVVKHKPHRREPK